MEEKKILIVGIMNETTNDINNCLGQYFNVQLCFGGADVLDGMMKIVKPDLVLINLVDFYKTAEDAYKLLSEEYKTTPVVTIGNSREYEKYLPFYQKDQFENLDRPVSRINVLRKCCYRMKVDPDSMNFVKKKQILIVDDDAMWLRTAKEWLKEKYEVILATSGTQAMTAIGKKKPDLILLDYEMPVCNGKQVFEMICSDEYTKEIPVVFLTGVSDKEHIEEVLMLKPAGYLLKLVAYQKLIDVLKKELSEK